MEYGGGCENKLLHLLSPREKEVLYWLRMGKTSWDVSKILCISERTVNYHVNNIIRKLGVVNRMQAVSVAANLDFRADAEANGESRRELAD